MRPTNPREEMTLNAIVEPMMMRERSVVMDRVVRMALTGTFHFGEIS
jgi:hypothetical protein